MGMFDDLIPQQQEQAKGDARSQIGKPEELNFAEKLLSGVEMPKWMENIRGTKLGRFGNGMADFGVGVVQLGAHLLPESIGAGAAVDKRVAEVTKMREDQFRAQADPSLSSLVTGKADPGTDWMRVAGNIVNPINRLGGGLLPAAESFAGRAAVGGAIGGVSALAAPVENANEGNYAAKKTGQTVLGVATGAVLSPALGAVADVAMRRLGLGAAKVNASSHDIDGALASALKDAGQTLDDVPPDQLAGLRAQVAQSLGKGTNLDAKALMRKADFEALGVDPTQAQITRDPKLFAREKNLSGIEGIGDELGARFASQGQALRSKLPGDQAKNAYQAGTQLGESLSGIDEKLRGHVSGLYNEARASAGKDLEVPLQGLAQDYADVLHRFGDKVPSGVRNLFGDYGLDPSGKGMQTKVFNFEEANRLLKEVNRQTGDPESIAALTALRGSLRKTIESADPSGGPFSPAVKAAAERFRMHDAIPALKAAADGSIQPDTFVRNFVVNGRTNDVKGLAMVLKQADPGAFQEARGQLADELRRAAFGAVDNVTGDSGFAPTRYMETIRRIGVDKLGAFFEPKEVADIMRVGRVGSYINAAPGTSAVNRSNTTSAAVNFLSELPGIRQAGAVVNNLVRPIQNRSGVKAALAAEVPATQADLSDAQRNYLRWILAGGGAAGAAVSR